MTTDPFVPFPDVPTLQQTVTDDFCELAKRCVQENGVFRVSLSGGSTPRRVYEMLVDRDLPWEQIHLFWGDERNVPHDHDDSNYRMVRTALIDSIKIPAENVHPVPVEVDSPERAAANYEQMLRTHFPTGSPQWDLVLLGMGDDAHTASLFPQTAAIDVQDRWFVENWVEKFDAYRYTMTYPAIEASNEIWFIITGAAKRDALRQVLHGSSDIAHYPSQRIKPSRWFVDAAAVG
ncbi:MAG: 6-phosphogluconolactonase [Planctomycetota bacterium]